MPRRGILNLKLRPTRPTCPYYAPNAYGVSKTYI
jgi:hypothetical protein